MISDTRNKHLGVSTNQRCLAVNAAFLREIKDDNRFLDELLLATRDALADQRLVRVRPMVELLRRLRDRLAMHFSMEEAFGYFDDAIEFPEEWSLEADLYRNQHASLYLDLCEIVELAERLLYHESTESMHRAIQRVFAAFAAFYRKLQQHEAGENDLIDRIFARKLRD